MRASRRRTVAVTRAVMVAAWSLIPGVLASAQQPSAQDAHQLIVDPSADTSRPAPDADRAAVRRDSIAGLRWMVAGHRDWSRYRHPVECNAVVNVVQRLTMKRTQQMHPSLADDTLSTAARETGGACIAKFSPSTTEVQDLPGYRAFALTLNDVPLAKQVIETQLAKAKTPDEKGSIIADALLDIQRQYPDQIAFADALVDRIATFGPQARWWRVVALDELPQPAAFDTARRVRIEQQMAAAYGPLSHDERMKSGPGMLALGNTWIQVREYRHASPEQLCRAQRDAGLAVGPDSVQGNTGAAFATFVDSTCLPFFRGQAIGQPVTSLAPGDWFLPGDTVSKRTLGYPRPGRVTLILAAPFGTGRPTPEITAARRLYERYAKDGLDIVLVHQRTGFVWGSAALAPAAETGLMRWYDHDYLKLPFPIAVYDAAATNLPHPMLIGRDGRRYASDASTGSDEIALDAFVRQALADRGASPP